MPTFLQLCAQPAYAPVPSGAADTASWTADGAAFAASGPYTVAEWTTEGLTYTKNPAYWDADNVAAETVRFVFQSDPNVAESAFLARDYALSWPVPDAALDDLRANHAPELRTVSQLGTYSLCFSMSDPALSVFSQTERAQIRTALALLIDRSYLCSEITPGAQQSANAPIPPGISDADGSAFTSHNGADGKGGGYYGSDYEANCKQAIALLRQVAESSGRFTVNAQGVCAGFPELTYLTSDAAGHVAIADDLQALYARYGISLTVTSQDMDTFLASRAAGGYSVTRCSFSAGIDDPMPFLSLWASGAGSNCVALGRGAHAGLRGLQRHARRPHERQLYLGGVIRRAALPHPEQRRHGRALFAHAPGRDAAHADGCRVSTLLVHGHLPVQHARAGPAVRPARRAVPDGRARGKVNAVSAK